MDLLTRLFPSRTTFLSPLCLTVTLLAGAVPACTEDDESPADTTTSGSASTGSETLSTSASNTGESSTSSTSLPDDSSSASTTLSDSTGSTQSTDDTGTSLPLGALASGLCQSLAAPAAQVREQVLAASADLAVLRALYLSEEGVTPLQEFVRTAGAALGRIEEGVLIDDKAIVDAFATNDQAKVSAEMQNRLVFLSVKVVRDEIGFVTGAAEKPEVGILTRITAWDQAYCVWNAFLAADAQAADALGLEVESIANDITSGFNQAHAALWAATDPSAIDTAKVGAAKQVLEKSLYRAAHRLIVGWGSEAKAQGSVRLAQAALSRLGAVEDRLAGRNTPGIAKIQTMLNGEPAAIDAAALERELCVAFAKRTRGYANTPIEEDVFGTPEATIAVYEGRTYAKICLPDMDVRVADFDAAVYWDHWQRFAQAVEAQDLAVATTHSQSLDASLCAYQLALGISVCTSSADEMVAE